MSTVTLLTVNYNSIRHINKLLVSIDKYLYENINQIIIVDNNSKDLKKLSINSRLKSKTKVIINKNNQGFAKAVNKGIKKSKCDYILLVNPDTYFVDDSIINSIELIENNKNIGLVGGQIIGTDNKIRYSATSKPNFFIALFEFTILKKILKKNSFSKLFWLESKDHITRPTNVFSVCGAFMVIRKDYPKLTFDSKYFLYLEDLDFGHTIENAGYLTIFNPLSRIKHVGGVSSNSKYRMVHKYWYKSRDYYFSKHFKGILGKVLQLVFSIEKFLLIIFKIGDLHNTINEK